MKRFPRKTIVLLAAAALLLTFAVSGTVAYLVAEPQAVVNTFTPVRVDTRIDESVAAGTKSSITVQNGNSVKDIPVYVRVAVVGNWVNGADEIVAPWKLTSYNTSKWTLKDGFYYYNDILQVGGTTADLLTGGGIKETDYADRPEEAHLMVTVVHQSIQAAGLPDWVDTAPEAFQHAADSTK